MPHDILLAVWLLVPVVALTLLRINAVAVFLGLCLGVVLVRFAAGDVESFVGIFAAHLTTLSTSTVQLALLMAPAALVSFLSLFSVHGRVRMLWNIVPAAGVSLLGVLLAVPLLGPGVRHALESQTLWHQLVRYQGLAAGVSVVLACGLLAGHRRRSHRGSEKSK